MTAVALGRQKPTKIRLHPDLPFLSSLLLAGPLARMGAFIRAILCEAA